MSSISTVGSSNDFQLASCLPDVWKMRFNLICFGAFFESDGVGMETIIDAGRHQSGIGALRARG